MRRATTALAIIIALSSFPRAVWSASKAAPDLSGNWVAEFVPVGTSNGEIDYFRFTLQQTGNTLTGTWRTASVTGSINNGKIDLRLSTVPDNTYSAVLKSGEMVGTARVPRGELKWRAYRETSATLPPQTHDFKPTQFHRLFSGTIAPALRIHSGDTVRTWTVDAGGSDSGGRKLSEGGNPQTGPFYVEGALPGDTLAVHLIKVSLNRDTAFSGGSLAPKSLDPAYHAAFKEPGTPNAIWQLDREHGVARLATPSDKLQDYTAPLRPMLGCIAVAPPQRMAFRTYYLGSFGGNLDYNRIREGTTVYLPVFQPGALLFVGDGHAAQGDGELTGNALETSLDLEFRVELIRGESAGVPRAEDAEYRMAMGIAGSLNEALQQATTNMARWLERDFKLNRAEVAYVLGTAMTYDVAEVVDPEYHVVARVSKEALSRIAQ
jgi:acetamidase/formamidase